MPIRFLALLVILLFTSNAAAITENTLNLPFGFEKLEASQYESVKSNKTYNPRNPYNIFINYELGMHCVGFDISYCCVIPPYNSIQSQVVKSGSQGTRPSLLTPEEVKLYYYIKDNTYSEGNKMRYWQNVKDVNGDGDLSDPGDNMANYVWSHLFIYKDLEGTVPDDWSEDKRLHIGKEIKVPIDAGPSGKHLSGGWMDYADMKGGNVVFTDTLIPQVKNVPLVLTSSYLWDALGLPLTAFYDNERRGTIRSITNKDFQPYQYSYVRLYDKNKKPIEVNGRQVEFFGTNPVDIPNCYACHSRDGYAAKMAKAEGLTKHEEEYTYWKKNYPDVSEYMARLSAGSTNILELHDAHHETDFLREYDPTSPTNRLGSVGPVNCADCHGDNISGNLHEPRSQASGYKPTKAKPLTESIHLQHIAFLGQNFADKAERTQSCQICHPTHWQSQSRRTELMNENPYQLLDDYGNPRYSNKDLRLAGGGCYLRRDAHTNPAAEPPFFLNEIGKWYLHEVSMKDEKGYEVQQKRGLYCTHCHNHLSQVLYDKDNLKNVVIQEGETLRNKSLDEIVKAVAGGDKNKFRNYYADPKVNAKGNPLYSFYKEHPSATLVKATKDDKGALQLLAWNADNGDSVPYKDTSAGSDWWLAASEPHCANCHKAPFVESEGGHYFPIDQPDKYALYRYSKAHGKIACQSCHESIHGLYPVRYEGPDNTVDKTTHEQALQFSPDGKYAGPVTCAACHTVNSHGVSVELSHTDYSKDYWSSVVLIHYMRQGDEKLKIKDLVKKYPYTRSREIVKQGWN